MLTILNCGMSLIIQILLIWTGDVISQQGRAINPEFGSAFRYMKQSDSNKKY